MYSSHGANSEKVMALRDQDKEEEEARCMCIYIYIDVCRRNF